MDADQAVDIAENKFNEAVERFKENLKQLRTGRANASMLDGVTAEAYGVPTPLNQIANISAPEAQLLQVTPFDPSNLQAIATAIRNNQQLGLNPTDDGKVIRIPIPALTEERRRDLAKQVGQKQEECMVAMRNARHDALQAIDAAKKNKELGEDEAKRLGQVVEDKMNGAKADAEAAAKTKEQEIMTL